MRKEYFRNLVDVVGSSFYYYTHMKEINLPLKTCQDYEKLTSGWIDEYQGKWNSQSGIVPLHFNMFKPSVDQLVHRIFEVTEDEISRRVNEELQRYLERYELVAKDKN